jgi:hypothetical protein
MGRRSRVSSFVLVAIALSMLAALPMAEASAAARAAPPLRPSGLGPVHFGMYPEQAERVLEKPITVEEGVYGCSSWTIQGIPAGAVQSLAFDGRLGYITVFRRGPETIGRIKVGDSVRRLRRRLRGRLHQGRSASEGYRGPRLFLTESFAGAIYTMEFDTYRGRVTSIEAATRHTIETFQECA